MKKLIISTLFVLSLIFVACGGGPKGEGDSGESGETGSIYGIVTDKATGDQIQNAGVELQPVGLKTVTGSDGQFEFNEIAAGKYTLYVTKTGYIDQTSNTIIVKSGKQSKGDVQLEKLPAALRIVDDAGNDILELDFGWRPDDVSRSFNIFNDSPASINWEISWSAEWIKSVSKESGNLAAGDTLGIIVKIDRDLLREGENLTQLHIISNNGNKQLKTKAIKSDPCKNNPCGHGVCKATGVEVYECECEDGYIFEDKECINKKISKCTGLLENSHWNTASQIEQNWNGKEWIPSVEGSYNEEASETECRFVCNRNYTWKGSFCEADSKVSDCEGLPENAVWNSAASITQTWNGTEWFPSATGSYNEEKSMQECRFKCMTNYSWNGSVCAADTRIAECKGLPVGAMWNTASSITQTWNGESWQPSLTGVYGETETTLECRFKCASGYTRENDTCINQKMANCTGLPLNAQWNTVSSITQKWNGSTWTPTATGSYNTIASTSECRFKCNTNYTWKNSKCEANTQTAKCTGLPSNAVWNSVSSITQTWSGEDWQPSTTGTYNTDASTTECRFKCNNNYQWNNQSCEAVPTRTVNCTGLSAHAVWNTVSKITQHWDGEDWVPLSIGSYNTTPSLSECRFQCDTNYEWNGSACVGATRTYNCSGLPENAVWNSVASYKQTWDGSKWVPETTITVYNETESLSECRFKCDSEHYWNDYECVNPCDSAPCSSSAHSTGECLPSSWDEYSCVCEKNYFWKNQECKKILPLGNTCTGLNKCFDRDYERNCSDTSQSLFGQDAYYASLGVCTPKDFTFKILSDQNVVVDNNTGLQWVKKFTDNTYTWDNAKNYCENLSYAGKNDWRLPTPQELLTIIDGSRFDRWPINTYFTYNPAPAPNYSFYAWSSKEYMGDTTKAYYLYVGSTGSYGISYRTKTDLLNVVCVSGQGLPSPALENLNINGGVVILDSTTGLMWQNQPQRSQVGYSSSQETISKALSYCEDLAYAGYEDWRLPNDNELASLMNYERYNPASDVLGFVSGCVYSSTLRKSSASNMKNSDFSVGRIGVCSSGNEIKVYCVRSSEEWSNPCDLAPCDIPNSKGCVPHGPTEYTCECEDGYYWWGKSGCTRRKPTFGNICPTASNLDCFGLEDESLNYCAPQSFSIRTVADQSIVVDNNTGLEWQQDISVATDSFEEAANYCATLDYGGYSSGWRLPTPFEWKTIRNDNLFSPVLNLRYFPHTTDTTNTTNGVGSFKLWSSLPSKYKGVEMLSDNFSAGSDPLYIRCVRGADFSPNAEFVMSTINNNEIVTDSTTGLIWQKTYATNKTWQQAISYCENLTYAGYDDWRMPNPNELLSLEKYDNYNDLESDFPDMPTILFWSSASLCADDNYAIVENSNELFAFAGKGGQLYVRCVRNE
jgi:hypothetical protein